MMKRRVDKVDWYREPWKYIFPYAEKGYNWTCRTWSWSCAPIRKFRLRRGRPL